MARAEPVREVVGQIGGMGSGTIMQGLWGQVINVGILS